jgi:hypothetical protein
MIEENFKDISLYKNIKKLLKHFYNSVKNNDHQTFNICLSNLQNINQTISKSSNIYLTGGDLSIQNEMLKNKIIEKIKSMRGGLGEEIYKLKQQILDKFESLKTGGPNFDVKKLLEDILQMQQYITQLGKLRQELIEARLAAEAKLSLSSDEISQLQSDLNGIGTTELDTLRLELKKFKQNIEEIVDPKNPLEAYNTMEIACKNYHGALPPTPPTITTTDSGNKVLQLQAPGTPGTPGTDA